MKLIAPMGEQPEGLENAGGNKKLNLKQRLSVCSNLFFPILSDSLDLVFIYCKYRSTVAKLIELQASLYTRISESNNYRLCGLVVRVPGYRSRSPSSIPGATRFSEKQWVSNEVY
jgi:hypothetical protein